MTIDRKNATMGLDRSETQTKWGRKLYRIVALSALTLLNGDTVQEGQRGGWCSDEVVITDRVTWAETDCTFWGGTFRGGTFRGGTFWGGTFEGGTFWGGTFEGGTFWGGTFEGGTFRGGTFWGGTFRGGDTTKTQAIFLAGLRWDVTITDKHIGIGCQHHTFKQWESFSDDQIAKMDSHALEFWQAYKGTIMALAATKEGAQ